MNSFSAVIIRWFREYGRELPWRETKDPYAIWLSEIILQQTRIAQGWEYWERFMKNYPKVEDLAAASEDDVLKLWQGLGYYSRARNLHAAARQIVELGHFPDTLEGIKALKGVGDYTAAAIGSFAFDIPAAVVDGNVYRVLSRYFGIDTPINSTQGKKEFAALAQSLLPASSAQQLSDTALSPVAAYNQGMMDFGAIQCTPQSPKCLVCPLAETCEALRTGRVEELPVKNKTLKVKTRHLSYIYIRCKGLYRKFMEKYLRQRPEVNTDLTLMVRHMEATQCGLPIEFYFFIKDKVWVNYEHILADIMEHAYALANEFDLKIYEQYPEQ